MYRGGLGQRLSFQSLSPEPLTFMIRHERIKYPPRGFLGGADGRLGVDLLDGQRIPGKSVTTIKQGQVVTFETPGAGGMFSPLKRDPIALAKDLQNGVVSAQSAQTAYGLTGSQLETLVSAAKRNEA
jgi:N-methylhydantoinase B